MIKQKILFISPYPISQPQHGGQKRAKAIFELYESIFAEGKFIAVYHRGLYKDDGESSILLGEQDIIKQLDEQPYASELISGRAIDDDIHVRSALAKLLVDYQPDIIHVEQVYPYLGLKPLLKDLGMHPKLIFSSQNIEYQMKRQIFQGVNMQPKIAGSLIKQTQELETDFSKAADLVIAVSQADAAEHRKMGARKVVVAPNGIDKKVPAKAELDYWKAFKQDKAISKTAVFIGSGHPPNWIGFLDMVGGNTKFIPVKSKILVAGGVSEYFKATYKPLSKYKPFWQGLVPLGRLSEEKLTGLIDSADVVLLPITSGGGSNLKTAEAIISGKRIVATTYAFRGFEEYNCLPNIYTADNRETFRDTILMALNSPYKPRTPQQVALAERVQWHYCLRPLLPELRKLSRRATMHKALRNFKRPARIVKRRLRGS